MDTTTVTNWERNRCRPTLRLIPKIIEFLGYVPFETTGGTLGERIKTYRRLLGLSQKRLASLLGVDPTTLARWEKDLAQPSKRLAIRLHAFLTSCIMDAGGFREQSRSQ